MEPLGVGIIGCGSIAGTYLDLIPSFRGLRVVACADLDPAAAEARAAAYGLRALPVEALLADPSVQVVVNLTVPAAHHGVSAAALRAGRHVWSEKPLVLSLDDGLALRDLAAERGLRLGSAPDTFMGAAAAAARAAIDDGRTGRIVAGSAAVMSHGMEHWHPNPGFFFQPGGGPMLDLGPYYIATLIHLIGPVRRVAALASAPSPTRRITSRPRAGEVIPVGTPTNIHALLEFEGGATVTLSTSWDVWAHRRAHLELYGEEGSVFLPDPNFFGGTAEIAGRDGCARPLDDAGHPFAVANQTHDDGPKANWRGAGLADMAAAIREGRGHRASLDRALHGVEVMLAILQSGEEGRFVALRTTCTRPDPMTPEAARALLA